MVLMGECFHNFFFFPFFFHRYGCLIFFFHEFKIRVTVVKLFAATCFVHAEAFRWNVSRHFAVSLA